MDREPSLDLGGSIRQLATVDLDGTTGDDLVASLDTSLVALRNRGDATFEIAYTATAPIAAFELHAADLDGDGASALVLGNREAIALVHLDGFTPGALQAIRKYDWPGNIRQLENRIKKAIVLCDKTLVGPEDMDLFPEALQPVVPLAEAREEFQRRYILEVLERNNGNRTKTARDLGVDPRTIFRYLEREPDAPDPGGGA